jgi:uncharacterized protein YecE (DUF72 family)
MAADTRVPASNSRPRISVGIGSWSDPEYVGVIFPSGVKPDERLAIYARHFHHVEVNASFHAIPPRDRVEGWVRQTPPDFVFDLKLHRAFGAPEMAARDAALMSRVLRSAEPLIESGKLGAFFLVLTPSFAAGGKSRLEELDGLVEKLRPHLLAVELRHNGWVAGEQRERTLEFFRARGIVWIAVDMPRIKGSSIMPPVDEVTNPRMAYLRLHGRRDDWTKVKTTEERHSYEYSDAELDEIAGRVRKLAEKAETVHVVANTHAQDFAPKAALALQRKLGITQGA